MPFDGNEKQYETKPDVFSLEGLIAWLETQPADGAYDYLDGSNCALCQYLRARGLDVDGLHIGGYRLKGSWTYQPYPDALRVAVHSSPYRNDWTFGYALNVARSLLSTAG